MIDAFFAPLSHKAAPQSFVVIKCRLRRLLADYLSASITEIVMCVNLLLPDRLSDAKAVGVIINIQPNWEATSASQAFHAINQLFMKRTKNNPNK